MILMNRISNLLNFNTYKPIHYSPNGAYIFIHINKTGGTSIDKSLGIKIKKHLTAKQVIDIVGRSKWDMAYKFAFVINPWDKVVSHYKYRIKTNQSLMKEKSIEFADWIRVTYGKDKDPFYYDIPQMFFQQVEWLKNNQNEIDIDFIGRFENIAEDFNKIQQKLKLFSPLPHLNKTITTDYHEFYKNQESIDIISNAFKDDINYFNYKFH